MYVDEGTSILTYLYEKNVDVLLLREYRFGYTCLTS